MRKTAITVAILALTILAINTRAEDDFSALLADLSFGDLPTVDQPLAVAETEPAEDLKPAPALVMPEITATEAVVAPVVEVPALEIPAVDAPSVPKVALQDPIPATSPAQIDFDAAQIDFDAAFALQNDGTPSQSVGHIFGHKNRCECEDVIICTPHEKPSLPSSSFYQYFRSNKCNVHVWDGYRQNCGVCNQHVLGQCDCFSGRNGRFGRSSCGSGCDRNDCGSCDGACDR